MAPVAEGRADTEGATGDRARTEEQLTAAALRLLERDGVLAGLNLREVAEEAGVNRGLIYHYFGSRRHLLRAALHRIVEGGSGVVDRSRRLPFAERRRRVFDILAAAPQLARLNALLVLDGDETFHVLPHIAKTRRDLQRDLDEGHLASDADAVALHVLTSATVLGYSLFRQSFARDVGIPVTELDARAGAAFSMLLGNVAHPAAAATRDDGG